jgi:hypothetical protein
MLALSPLEYRVRRPYTALMKPLCLALTLWAPLSLSAQDFGDLNIALPAKGARPAQKPAESVPDPVVPDPKPAPVISGDADMSLFFQRLEDLGFDTKELRSLSTKLDVKFRAPNGDAFAEWGYILKNLYIPAEFKEKTGSRIRYDLRSDEVDTVIHEFTHAERTLTARKDAAKGTPAREHYEAVEAIWGDLRSRSLLYRFAWLKADEVSGYFMGAAISRVVEASEDIVLYNTFLAGSKVSSPEEAERLGGKLELPTPADAKDAWSKGFVERYSGPFGRSSVSDTAMFKDNTLSSPALIGWNESQWVKDHMYNNILGLKPPKNIVDLLDRMNRSESAWARGVRAKVLEARRKNGAKAQAAR